MPSVTRRRPHDPDRRSAVESQVLAATTRLLQEGHRFTDLGVQRIAAEAGVARSTFYVHFRDKTELLVRLAGTMQETSLDRVQGWDPVADGLDGLTQAFTDVIGTYRAYAPVLAAISEVAAYDEVVREFWASALDAFVVHTAGLIRAERDAGRIPADVDPDPASRLVVLGGDRFLAHHVSLGPSDPVSDAAAARELAATWWYGAFRRPTRTPTPPPPPPPPSIPDVGADSAD
ncbi:TetR/AcrR family transcriptional regulator [Micromonospora mirobrigensis]|uniref:Transcriptional regulator, TetR family n=1 Tax=Micromonospora mirobrigensis TaxID=262898 RepID=A0A1C5AKT2_9ACTN|nr:TetR/AcrR family transcriptional regulator [Micromonospora mirobrigensis]SCF45671.1 transcriptional regulator, TetR family [Micromonospora mirobrigensis]